VHHFDLFVMEGMISDVSLHPARQILIVIFGLQVY